MFPATRKGSEVLTSLVVFAACGYFGYTIWATPSAASRTPPAPTQPVSIDGATLKGNPAANVVLVEWVDYGCPMCRKSELEVMPVITRDYLDTGKVQLAFFQHPVPKLYPLSQKAAEAVVCAGRQDQNKFWDMDRLLFEDQEHLEEVDLFKRAEILHLDRTAFASCLSGAAIEQIARDVRYGEALDPNGAPTFFVGRRRADGQVDVTTVLRKAQPLVLFTQALDAALRMR